MTCYLVVDTIRLTRISSSVYEGPRGRRAEPCGLWRTQANPAVLCKDQGSRRARGQTNSDREPRGCGAHLESRLGMFSSVSLGYLHRKLTAYVLHLQADNKTLSAKLAEKIAEERAKALLKSAAESKKRGANETAKATGSESSPSQNKKPKVKGKGKNRN